MVEPVAHARRPARVASQHPPRSRTKSQEAEPRLAIARANLFPKQTWYIPPPPPPPPPYVPPPPPQAPALPFSYMGRWQEDGQTTYYLTRGTVPVSARAGQVLDGAWRLEPVRAAFEFHLFTAESGAQFAHGRLNCSTHHYSACRTARRPGLTGCASPGLTEGRELIARRPTEAGLARLRAGMNEEPDNLELKSYYYTQREKLASQWLLQAQQEIEQANFDAAGATLQKVLTIHPENPRAKTACWRILGSEEPSSSAERPSRPEPDYPAQRTDGAAGTGAITQPRRAPLICSARFRWHARRTKSRHANSARRTNR